jgi:hypothetical protein
MDRDCTTCEFYARLRRPGAGVLAPSAHFCMGLGFYQPSTAVAIDCRLYRARPGVTGHRGGL